MYITNASTRNDLSQEPFCPFHQHIISNRNLNCCPYSSTHEYDGHCIGSSDSSEISLSYGMHVCACVHVRVHVCKCVYVFHSDRSLIGIQTSTASRCSIFSVQESTISIRKQLRGLLVMISRIATPAFSP